MPGMSGLEVVCALEASRPSVIVGLLTGWNETRDAAQLRSRCVSPGEWAATRDLRAGWWRWENAETKECGLHVIRR
jgi:CheY-like chemotaxis protein